MFSHPHFIVKAVRFCYRKSTDIEQFKIQTVVNTLGSVVDMYSVPSLNNLCRVLELEELTLAY